MRIQWLEDAVYDLQAARDFIAKENPFAAGKIAARILKSIELLVEHPGMGRQGRVLNTRELVIIGTPYMIPYRVKNDVIEILRVFHSSMQWPATFAVVPDYIFK